MSYSFRNLVFEGGGVKGIAYLGAMEVLEEKGILQDIVRIGGTSAGAINAILVGLGYDQTAAKKLLWSMDFNKIMDDSFGVVRDTSRLINEFGWHKGDYFRDWIGDAIKAKTGNSESTFADIEAMKVKHGFKSLFFIGTNLSTTFSEVFSAEHTPRLCVADAVRISMSIPLFFAAHRSARGDVYVDGGVLNNYPIKLFDRAKYVSSDHSVNTEYYKKMNDEYSNPGRPISQYVFNKQTLGFRLDSKEKISLFRDGAEPIHKKVDSFFDYSKALITTLIDAQQSTHLHSDDWNRTIYIDSIGVGTTDFDLTDEVKINLVESGRSGTEFYFK